MAREVEKELLWRLGRLVTRWAFVEQCISDYFVHLVEGNPVLMIAVTANVSQNAITGWTRTLLQLRDTNDPEFVEKVLQVLNDVDELRPQRNALVHGLWTTEGPADSALVQTIRLDRREVLKEEVVTAADLDDLIESVEDVIRDLVSILNAVGVTT